MQNMFRIQYLWFYPTYLLFIESNVANHDPRIASDLRDDVQQVKNKALLALR